MVTQRRSDAATQQQEAPENPLVITLHLKNNPDNNTIGSKGEAATQQQEALKKHFATALEIQTTLKPPLAAATERQVRVHRPCFDAVLMAGT